MADGPFEKEGETSTTRTRPCNKAKKPKTLALSRSNLVRSRRYFCAEVSTRSTFEGLACRGRPSPARGYSWDLNLQKYVIGGRSEPAFTSTFAFLSQVRYMKRGPKVPSSEMKDLRFHREGTGNPRRSSAMGREAADAAQDLRPCHESVEHEPKVADERLQ